MSLLAPSPPEDPAVGVVLGRIARAVCVVTARHGTDVHAMTVDSLTSACADPPRVVLAARSGSRWWRVASASGGFAVSVLAAGQEDCARWFASRRRGTGQGQFAGRTCRTGRATGAPLLDGAVAWLECLVERSMPVGEQIVVSALVAGESGCRDEPGLLRMDRSYGTTATWPGQHAGAG